LLVAGAALIAIGIAAEAAVPVSSVPVWVAAVAWAVAGLGMGLAYSTATLIVIETAEPGAEGAASAGMQLANTLGVAIGTGVAGGVIAFGAIGLGGIAPAIAIADMLLVVACGLTLAVIGRIPDEPRRAVGREPSPVSSPGL
jgi:MFS family permease